ncbi:hypothetical protein [Candidatus Palauibacter sp.]|uniref:hypothetical protein n=1 Tax=Candidatus Palauibacter sp. TaxID=3101350 RepID=UPI003B52C0E9
MGYLSGERVFHYLSFSEEIEVVGVPYLEIEVGEHTRMARTWPGGTTLRSVYHVTRNDHDADGISISADALALVNGAEILSYATGEAIDLTVPCKDREGRSQECVEHGPVENDRRHRVRPHDPEPGPRECTIERREALKFVGGEASVVGQWDGTPIRVDIVNNFPADRVTEDDLYELLAPIAEAAAVIEAELGYPIIEAGEVLPVPDGTPAGWDSSYDGYRAALARGEPPLVREHAQVIAHYLDDDAWFWDHWGGPPMVAHSSDGFTTFNARTMREWWDDRDDCCLGRWAANGRYGAVIVHEVFHLLGFKHPDDPVRAGVFMNWGSTIAPWLSGSKEHYVDWNDIDVLKCVFPEQAGEP